ncbi:MAG: SnoaL-like polyketide cyclase, partial [Flavobacteriaceae bacterium]|nr:SnoaL-like polyketide cyclase [Flavobacteriaceae bacterium]
DSSQIDDGADSYIVREGLIIAQTIHYTIRKIN